MAAASDKESQFIVAILVRIQRLQLFFASALFLLITADAFGMAALEGPLGSMVFLVCALFLCQTGVMYWVFYQRCNKSRFREKLKMFLPNIALAPFAFIAAAAVSFFFKPFPLAHKAYALALLSLIPISQMVFRQMFAKIPSASNLP